MNKARKGPAFLVIFLMLLLIVAYIYAAYQTVKPARGLICNGVFVETVNVGGMRQEQPLRSTGMNICSAPWRWM